jgi:hypothetical protein
LSPARATFGFPSISLMWADKALTSYRMLFIIPGKRR